eukprot:scaffold336970_cov38-Prasinocladus_malaysianus.AAC.1
MESYVAIAGASDLNKSLPDERGVEGGMDRRSVLVIGAAGALTGQCWGPLPPSAAAPTREPFCGVTNGSIPGWAYKTSFEVSATPPTCPLLSPG